MSAPRPPAGYQVAPRCFRLQCVTLPCDLFMFLPANQTVLRIRAQGDTLGPSELATLSRVLPENVLIRDTEPGTTSAFTATVASDALNAGTPDAAAVVSAAAHDMLAATPELKSTADPERSVQRVTQWVERVQTSLRHDASAQSYEALLNSLHQSSDPIDAHCRQVGATASLILMIAGDTSPTELQDAGIAGLFHDVGLRALPPDLVQAHLQGQAAEGVDATSLYQSHVEHSLEAAHAAGLAGLPGVLRAIELHHEYWDGTGFRTLTGARVFRPARALRAADEILSRMYSTSRTLSFAEAVRSAHAATGTVSRPLLDPVLLGALRKAVG